jgi:uncharacterized phage-associated protein
MIDKSPLYWYFINEMIDMESIKDAEYSVEDVAKYFIYLSNKTKIDDDLTEGITNLKLQKMLYFAQAAYLSLNNQKLFNEDIEAWQYGPVIPSIYHKYKEHRNQPIPNIDEEITIDDDLNIFLDGIWELFDKYSAIELMNITHKHKPWNDAYSSRSKVIRPEILRDYYKGFFTYQEDEDGEEA